LQAARAAAASPAAMASFAAFRCVITAFRVLDAIAATRRPCGYCCC
jgi:hypothetical protein